MASDGHQDTASGPRNDLESPGRIREPLIRARLNSDSFDRPVPEVDDAPAHELAFLERDHDVRRLAEPVHEDTQLAGDPALR